MNKLIDALMKAQKDFPIIPKNRIAKMGTYSYKYADLSDILSAVSPILHNHGLVLYHKTEVTDHGTKLITIFRNEDCMTESELMLPNGLTPHELGSALTYYRRYSICNLLGIVAEDDDDGQSANKNIQELGKLAPKANPANSPITPGNGSGGVILPTKAPSQPTLSAVSDAQVSRLNTIAGKANPPWTHEQIKDFVLRTWGHDSTKKLTREQYKEFCDVILPMGAPAGTPKPFDADDDLPF